MNDLEICKRIAEIEDVPGYTTPYYVVFDTPSGKQSIYNPLTDDALCFKLMVKYEVQISHEDPNHMSARCEHDVKFYLKNENPNKAICLAIIEAHND